LEGFLMSYYQALKKIIKGKIKQKESLAHHTTLRIGGPAAAWVEPKDLEDLKAVVKFAYDKKISLFCIGAGSNLLVGDKGIDGIIVKLNSPFFKTVEKINKNHIVASGGAHLKDLISFAHGNYLTGCEFLIGIPGSIGGALAMNAGINIYYKRRRRKHYISDIVKEVTVMDFRGRIRTLKNKNISFGYRASSLSHFIVISAKFLLHQATKIDIRREEKRYLNARKSTSNLRYPNAGCVFRNPELNSAFKLRDYSFSAGWFIDQCDLKGKRINDAAISNKHANYIVNRGKAKAKDVLSLIQLVQCTVKNRFNIDLVSEIKIIC